MKLGFFAVVIERPGSYTDDTCDDSNRDNES